MLAVAAVIQAVRLGVKRHDWLPVQIVLGAVLSLAMVWWVTARIPLGR
jgi:hypothetical protein